MGQNTHWLDAVATIAVPDVLVERIECSEGFPECLAHMPPAEPRALLLVEAVLHVDMADLVRELRARGWQYVVVVAADPQESEARALLRNGLAFDYWIKSYEHSDIRRDLERNLRELWGMGDEQNDDPDRG
jgi:hypothetical protein